MTDTYFFARFLFLARFSSFGDFFVATGSGTIGIWYCGGDTRKPIQAME